MISKSGMGGWIIAITMSSLINIDAQVMNYPSARGARAKVMAVGKSGESRIEIRLSNGKLVRWRSFASPDGEHGKVVGHAEWTADAQFFVFSTSNTGGHQPWSWTTYIYSRRK